MRQSFDYLRSLAIDILASIRRTYADHMPLYLCAIVFLAATKVIVDHYHVPLPIDASLYFLYLAPQFLLLAAAVIALIELVRLARNGMPPSPLRAVGKALVDVLMKGERPGNIFHTLVTLAPLMIAFAALKEEIPKIHPFAWDKAFMEAGLWIGFGQAPSMRLQPLLGHPPITAALSLVYDFWFVVMFGSLFCVAFSAKVSQLRMQFLLSFALCWFISGNILATIFSSAGPCYYGFIVPGSNPYAEHMRYLRETAMHWPVWSVRMQDILWHSYVTGDGAVKGISAMPSMHVTIAILVACLGCRLGRWWGIASVTFAVLICLGSVHLAWHYTVDGLMGALSALVFWWAAGWALRFAPARKVQMPALATSKSPA